MRSILMIMIAALTGLFSSSILAADESATSQKKQYVLLKLDDVVQFKTEGQAVSPRWQRVSDYIEQNGLKAGFGIICASLEKDNPAYYQWIRERQARGSIEFWLHGYWMRPNGDGKGEFEQGTAEEQQAIFEKAEKLAQEKLGFPLAAFGPHWSGTTDETEKALQAVPEIKIWLYGPKNPKYFQKASYPRFMALENPIFNPKLDAFKAQYEKFGFRQNPLVLQGHPDQWNNDERWNGFVQIVEYLQSKGVVFTTPSEYLTLTVPKN